IATLPEITLKIIELVEDPTSTAQDLHNIISNDPALCSRILKVVNSAFYGLPSQVASLDRAIIMLGLSAVKNIALAASLSRLFKPGAINDQFAAKDLWSHCVSVAVCAKLLTKTARGPHKDEAFVAGLVHDMGLLVEHQLFPEQLKEVVDRCIVTPQDFNAAEREIIGADHQAFGAALAAKWKFPPGLRHAISYHHNPTQLKPEFRTVATIIHVADIVCCQDEYGFWLTAREQSFDDELLATVGLTATTIDQLRAD
ncbi:MAG: HDOD domain-containing protein, partial [bacterium]|nr:HDOD domain-containing protein [bacterium]